MPDRVFCRRHDPDGHANWDSGFRPLLDDTCYMCATLKLEQAHRDATEEVAKAHKRGWEQCQRECADITDRYSVRDDVFLDIKKAISAMDYKEPTND